MDDDLVRMQGTRSFAIFVIVAGSLVMPAAAACLTVTDPPFCVVLFLAGVLMVGGGSYGTRRRHPAPRNSVVLATFVCAVVLALGSFIFWK